MERCVKGLALSTLLLALLAAPVAILWSASSFADIPEAVAIRRLVRRRCLPKPTAIRREFRTLSEDQLRRVVNALWVLKNTSSEEGRRRYGAAFLSWDEAVVKHACASLDPRCDQGHNGPSFMTFHRAMLREMELAFMAVDPKIEGLPYWNVALDSVNGTYRHDPEKYIFGPKHFGSREGTGPGKAVVDGPFAWWPVPEFTPERFGQTSSLAQRSTCVRNEYFKGTKASTCSRCCLEAPGTCTCLSNDTFPQPLRDHDDCNHYVARGSSYNGPLPELRWRG